MAILEVLFSIRRNGIYLFNIVPQYYTECSTLIKLMLLFSFFIFIFGVVLMCVRRIHLITIFLGMEFRALGLFSIVGSLSAYNSLFILLLVICTRVSEAAIMLSLMVIMTRLYGNDRCLSLMTDKS